jgi:hypothetical protein
MDAINKEYAYKNEISLSIGDESVNSSTLTSSKISMQEGPTPSPRQNIDEKNKPLIKNIGKMKKIETGVDNKAFDADEKSSVKPLSSFGNGNDSNLNDLGVNGANKNGHLNEKKLAGEKFF